jgi:hypothetical protein
MVQMVEEARRRLGAQHPVTGMRYTTAKLTPRAKRGRCGAEKGI